MVDAATYSNRVNEDEVLFFLIPRLLKLLLANGTRRIAQRVIARYGDEFILRIVPRGNFGRRGCRVKPVGGRLLVAFAIVTILDPLLDGLLVHRGILNRKKMRTVSSTYQLRLWPR